MKLVVATRETTCYICHEIIIRGDPRLDDTIRLRNSTAGDQKYRRLHYHSNCYKTRIEEFENNPPETPAAGGGGRPKQLAGLTEEQIDLRKLLLNRLRNHNRYWLSKLKLQIPYNELDLDDLQAFKRYIYHFHELAEMLKTVGGLPNRYQAISLSKLQETIDQASALLLGNVRVTIPISELVWVVEPETGDLVYYVDDS